MKSAIIGLQKPAPLKLRSFVGLMNFGHWLNEYEASKSRSFEDRLQLFRYIDDQVNQSGPIDYLEFGVFKGESIAAWAELNRDPASRFWGFDSFEGLPEDWNTASRSCKKGTFSTEGRFPAIDDPRVAFVKGWFQHTLPGFLNEFAGGNRIVVHLDADLYSSTLYVLSKLDHLLVPGSVVIFDDFAIVTGVFPALLDYGRSFLRKYRVIAHQGEFYQYVAIQFD